MVDGGGLQACAHLHRRKSTWAVSVPDLHSATACAPEARDVRDVADRRADCDKGTTLEGGGGGRGWRGLVSARRQRPEVEPEGVQHGHRFQAAEPCVAVLVGFFPLNSFLTRFYMHHCHAASCNVFVVRFKNRKGKKHAPARRNATHRCAVAQHRNVRESIRAEFNLDIKEKNSRLQALGSLPASRIFLPCRHRLTYILLLMLSLRV